MNCYNKLDIFCLLFFIRLHFRHFDLSLEFRIYHFQYKICKEYEHLSDSSYRFSMWK